jgi:light-regulated signal transduction histidine kinase (bacteriophytochrome)
MRLTVRMDSLLDSLLHFSRVGRTTLEYESVNLNEVLDEALEMIGVRRTDDSCTIEIPRSLPVIPGDRVRVREIFSNLISNSLKYTQQTRPRITVGYLFPDEAIHVSSAPDENKKSLVFYVQDDGIGIDSKHYTQVFRMFKRLHGRDDFGGGVGAGLTIVEKAVQRHGGQIWLDSSGGLGTTFYFTLPGVKNPNP